MNQPYNPALSGHLAAPAHGAGTPPYAGAGTPVPYPAAAPAPASTGGVSPYRIYLRNVRISYPKLAAPDSFQPDQPKKYGASFVFGLDEEFGQQNMQVVGDAANRLKAEFWRGEPDPYIKDDRKCLRQGETIRTQQGQIRPELAGKWQLVARSEARPRCYDRTRRELQPDEIRSVIYAGCRVDAIVTLYGIKDPAKGGNGIFAMLDGVMFRDDDEAFGAAPVEADQFDQLPARPQDVPHAGAAMPGAPAPAYAPPAAPGAPAAAPPAGGWGGRPF